MIESRRHIFIPQIMQMRTFGPRGGAAGNGLLNNLIAYWPGNEASGNALDLHTNGLTLTDVNTVTSNPGKVYALARQYTNATAEYHWRTSEALLQGTGDFTLAAWVYMDSKAAVAAHIIAKWWSSPGFRCYVLVYTGGATDRFQWVVRNSADSGYGIITANTFGSPSVSTWYLVVASHDSANTQLLLSVNGTTDTLPYANGVLSGTGNFHVGALEPDSAIYSWDGRIGPTMFWKSAAGGGGVLTALQRTALYNAGAGLPYASFTV